MHKKIVVVAFALLIALSSISTFASEGNSENLPGGDMNQQIINDPIYKESTPLKAESTPFGKVQLTWPEDPAGTGYIVYRYDTLLQRYEPIKTITDSDTTTYIDTNVEDNKSYRYQVTPALAQVQHSNSVIVSIDTKSVKPTVDVSVSERTAELSWNAIEGASGYEIYRSTSEDGKYAKVSTTSKTEVSDGELKKDKTYFYKVRAFQEDDFTSFSPVVNTGVIGEDDLIWPFPASTYPSCGFGPRVSPTGGASSDHKGIDLAAPAGNSVLAAQSGTVVESSYHSLSGNYIVLQHDNGMMTRYHHLSASKVSVGDTVKTGDTIGLSGNTGVSTGAHLHFELHIDGVAVDPLKYL